MKAPTCCNKFMELKELSKRLEGNYLFFQCGECGEIKQKFMKDLE